MEVDLAGATIDTYNNKVTVNRLTLTVTPVYLFVAVPFEISTNLWETVYHLYLTHIRSVLLILSQEFNMQLKLLLIVFINFICSNTSLSPYKTLWVIAFTVFAIHYHAIIFATRAYNLMLSR